MPTMNPYDIPQEYIDQWNVLRRSNSQEAAAYYTRHILPVILEHLRPMGQQLQENIQALILVGSLQADTASMLLASLNPERVAFLLTRDSQDFPKKLEQQLALLGILPQLRTQPKDWLPQGEYAPTGDINTAYLGLFDDHASVMRTYQGVRAILEQWEDLPRTSIAVDLTGGKSTMTVGLAKSAHMLGLTSVYIDSKYDNNQVIQGSQRLAETPDPYLIFGDLKAAEAQYHCQSYQYSIAAQLFTELAERIKQTQGLSAELTEQLQQSYGQRYTAAACLSAAYAAWEVLDFEEAAAHLERLRVLSDADIAEIAPFRHILEQQLAALNMLHVVTRSVVQRGDEALQTLSDPDSVLPLLGTLYTNALRRASQERYDVAALFEYRCLELISQHRLAAHGILTSAPDFEQLALPKAELNRRFQDVQRAIGRTKIQGLSKKRSIALFDGYMLLVALDDPLVQGYDILQIEQRSAARNQSILAHGYRLIQQQEYESFAEVVHAILERLFGVLGKNRDQWQQRYTFVMPFAERR